MKLGIIKETKIPEDNRDTFTPKQLALMKSRFDIESIVQSSDVRAINNNEYEKEGIKVLDDLSNCDILFGIKEVDINALIPNKHYFFFAHVAKKQEYNRPLLKKMMELGITLTDYEYIVNDENVRLVAFGWWAGVVGVYNTLRAYGLKYNLFELEKPHLGTTLDQMIEDVLSVKLPVLSIAITGNGRVSKGAQYFLDKTNIVRQDFESIRNNSFDSASYFVLNHSDLVKHRNSNTIYSKKDFTSNPEMYESRFMEYTPFIDVFIPCHYWGAKDPIYLSESDLQNPNNKIRVIGDVTYDIKGGIKSTLRASTHDAPFYDYNPETHQEEVAFSSDRNITVMAVDTLPNALSIDTSNSFGEQLLEHVIPYLEDESNEVIKKGTILKDGKLTERFEYLKDFVSR